MKRYRAFTFIEMMIALTVFSIGVLAVMRLITQNLSTMDTTETTTMASFLAQEGISLAYTIRDANLQKGLPRNCVLDARPFNGVFDTIDPDQACSTYFSSGVQGQIFLLGFSSHGYFSVATGNLFSGNMLFDESKLYRFVDSHEGKQLSWYAYTGVGGEPTYFAKYIVFTGVIAGNLVLPLQNILKIEVHVLSKKGSSYQDTVLESFIGKH